MITTELRYEYDKENKIHLYYVPEAHNSFTSWIWFSIGKHFQSVSKKIKIVPYHPSWQGGKVILTADATSAINQGIQIANKIVTHHAIWSKKKK